MVRIQLTALPRVGVEPGAGAPDVQQGFLGDLLGLGRVADDPEHQPVDPGGHRVVELGERASSPRAQALRRAAKVGARGSTSPGRS